MMPATNLSRSATTAAIGASGVIAVVRVNDAGKAVSLVDALLDGGLPVVEFAFSDRSALRAIERAVELRGDRALIGAGTVLDPETARAAILAGARFVVAPSLDVRVIEMCHLYSIPVFPGALTPTEVLGAWRAGAEAVKVFPAGLFGPGYIRDLRGPFPGIEFIPTGGIDAGNAADYLRAGAMAVGAGSSLVPQAAVEGADWAAITARARALAEAVRAARGG